MTPSLISAPAQPSARVMNFAAIANLVGHWVVEMHHESDDRRLAESQRRSTPNPARLPAMSGPELLLRHRSMRVVCGEGAVARKPDRLVDASASGSGGSK